MSSENNINSDDEIDLNKLSDDELIALRKKPFIFDTNIIDYIMNYTIIYNISKKFYIINVTMSGT